MSDSYVRRYADDYAAALAALLPTGAAWPRDSDGDLMGFVAGLAGIWGGEIAGRADDLLVRETDPRSTLEMLTDWERAFGLPDPCVAEPLTIGDRQKALVAKMTTQGGQSRAYFIALAASIGYAITIREFAPFMCGISEVGDTRPTGTAGEAFRWEIGAPEMRFYWTVKVGAVRLTWFRVGGGGSQTGVDPHLRIALATDLECLLRRWKPAHTDVIFDYSGDGISDPMAGTP
jgi:uncharacterized protein YmfQ (DUF2313 family)